MTVFPNSVEALSETVRQCAADRLPFAPIGSGSKFSWGNGLALDALMLVSTAKLDQMIDHAVGDLTVTVQAGMRFGELQTQLKKAGQFVAIDPSYEDCATVGGIVATGDSGALRHRYNSVRDMVLGVELVRSDGERVKAGGRVVKNVAGYDLMKLLTGSYGTLGIMTQVTLRLYPLQESSQTVFLLGEASAVARVMQALLNSGLTPTAIDLLSATVCEPLDLSAAMGLSMGLLVRFQGLAESVTEQVKRLMALGQSQELTTAVPLAEDQLWQCLGQVLTREASADRVLCKWAVRSAETVATLSYLQEKFPDASARFHVGGGLGQVQFPSMTAAELLGVRSFVEARGGFLTVLEAPDELKASLDVWGYQGNGLGWMRSIKQRFDPQGLLSPGRLG
ncbi:MAG: FAD-binding oxidoreductase [Alkalinema sp. FL-bin-369]|nr:FAD-binding oxidoreductase [Leptolyngbyaceae cyanobacterium LF-bin-369]